MSQVQASHLMKFSQKAKLLGNGLVVIDFGSRVGNISNSYRAGENWERELFVESSSFLGSLTASTIVINTGLAFLTVATPAGWVGLLIYGITVTGVAAGTAMYTDSLMKDKMGSYYDYIMKAIN
jgi:hypothetical protein